MTTMEYMAGFARRGCRLNNLSDLIISALYILYALLIVAFIEGWRPSGLALSVLVWSPPCLIMLGYRWWINDCAPCAGRE